MFKRRKKAAPIEMQLKPMTEMPDVMLENLCIEMVVSLARQRKEHVLKTMMYLFEDAASAYAIQWATEGMDAAMIGAKIREIIGDTKSNVNVTITSDDEVLH